MQVNSVHCSSHILYKIIFCTVHYTLYQTGVCSPKKLNILKSRYFRETNYKKKQNSFKVFISVLDNPYVFFFIFVSDTICFMIEFVKAFFSSNLESLRILDIYHRKISSTLTLRLFVSLFS